MANIQPTKQISIEKELGDLRQYKYQPNSIMQVSLNRLEDILDGKVKLLEPSTPFTYLLETTCLNTAFAVQEFAMLTRKLYPRLANTDEVLYHHLSDSDFLGRSSEPSYAKVIFNIMFNDFQSKAAFDPITREYIFKLPRHLKVLVGKYVYLLTSAIVMRLNANGVVDVRFENQDFNNIFPVRTNHINFSMRNVGNNEQYISFDLDLPEVDVEVSDIPVDLTAVFNGNLGYNIDRQFYFMRVFFNKDGKWVEMLVTHTNEVYDISKPTCIIKVLPTTHTVKYSIPSVYLNTQMVTGNIRVLIYTTTGHTLVNFSDYKIADFSVEYGDVFAEEELDAGTAPLQTITKIVYIQENITSGKDGLSFEGLKQAVIDNSIGDRKLPITSKQLEFNANQNNFRIIKDVDVVTNRLYKLETQTPSPITRYPLTKHNLDILEYMCTIDDLRQGNGTRAYGEDITVIPEGTIFKLKEGGIQHISTQEADQVRALTETALVAAVNNTKYISLYYHYVLDTSDGNARLRAYDLTTPVVKYNSFKTFNPTARIGINSVTNNLYKTPNGYTLDVLTNLKKFTETIAENKVKPYLVYTDVAGSKFYLSSFLFTSIEGQPVYRFEIASDYYISAKNKIHVTNFLDANASPIAIFIDLESKLEVLYVSSAIPPGFISTEMDQFIQTSYLAGGKCAVTLEDITLSFGNHLQYLFSTVHSSVGRNKYEIYNQDVPLRYTKTVYAADNSVLHSVGDYVLNDEGEQILQHVKGDVKEDSYGQSIPVTTNHMQRFLNLLFIDYRVGLCSGKADKQYSKEIRSHITQACLHTAKETQDLLLDNSEAFVVVPKTVGFVRVKTDTSEVTIPSAQRFSVSVYVQYDIYNNAEARENITYTVIKTVDEYLHNNNTLKKTQVLNDLYVSLKEFVVSVAFDVFTEINAEYIQVVDNNSRVSIDKTLVSVSNGYQLKENIDVSFKLVD